VLVVDKFWDTFYYLLVVVLVNFRVYNFLVVLLVIFRRVHVIFFARS
jgi:hypothetical protein